MMLYGGTGGKEDKSGTRGFHGRLDITAFPHIEQGMYYMCVSRYICIVYYFYTSFIQSKYVHCTPT